MLGHAEAGLSHLVSTVSDGPDRAAHVSAGPLVVHRRRYSIAMPAKSVAVHPSPKAGISVAFKSPVSGSLSIEGNVADADVNCGDGVEWRLQHNQVVVVSGAIANGGKQVLPGTSVTVDLAGNTYVTGTTHSTDFPVANAHQPQNGGGHGDGRYRERVRTGPRGLVGNDRRLVRVYLGALALLHGWAA